MRFKFHSTHTHTQTIHCTEMSIYVKNRFTVVSLRVWRLILTYPTNPFVFFIFSTKSFLSLSACVPALAEAWIVLLCCVDSLEVERRKPLRWGGNKLFRLTLACWQSHPIYKGYTRRTLARHCLLLHSPSERVQATSWCSLTNRRLLSTLPTHWLYSCRAVMTAVAIVYTLIDTKK